MLWIQYIHEWSSGRLQIQAAIRKKRVIIQRNVEPGSLGPDRFFVYVKFSDLYSVSPVALRLGFYSRILPVGEPCAWTWVVDQGKLVAILQLQQQGTKIQDMKNIRCHDAVYPHPHEYIFKPFLTDWPPCHSFVVVTATVRATRGGDRHKYAVIAISESADIYKPQGTWRITDEPWWSNLKLDF